jgi:acetoacetyl-CoA synthetase
VFFCSTRYRHGGRVFSRASTMKSVVDGLTSLQHVIHVAGQDESRDAAAALGALRWAEILSAPAVAPEVFRFEQVPFDHPLWILFTSGTTGLPKPIVQGHGGILLEQMKHTSFNFDLRARQRIFFYTTTGWMMWNFLAGALLSDVVPVLYDGHASHPDASVLWKLVEESKAAVFGASPAYIRIIRRAGLVPREHFSLEHLDTLSLAGSPVSAECMAWCSENIKPDLWVSPGSGGTEVCTGFVGGVAVLPVRAGEIQARALGCAAYAFNRRGERVVNEVGELVITEPMPSMPLYFWRDPGYKRYLESYFDTYPGVWCHGDLFRLTRRGTCQVIGRSDATLNRQGVRIGTAEIYRALEGVDEVDDGLIVNLLLPGGGFFMPLFVSLKSGVRFDDRLEAKIRAHLRDDCSPRHVPDRIYQVDVIPYTRSGKKLELPVRHILMGMPLAKAADVSALTVPGSLDWFVRFARRRSDYSLRRRA